MATTQPLHIFTKLIFFIKNHFKLIMDSELIKWLAQMPKNYSLSGSKTSFYNGEKQLKLFLKIKDN